MSELIGGLGTWEAFIGGVLLIITAIQNPEGIAGGIRTKVAAQRRLRAEAAASTSSGTAGPPSTSVSPRQPIESPA